MPDRPTPPRSSSVDGSCRTARPASRVAEARRRRRSARPARTPTSDGRHPGEVGDHGAGIDLLEPVQAQHRDRGEDRAEQRDRGRDVVVPEPRLLDQDDADHPAGDRQQVARRRPLAERPPRHQDDPDRVRVRQRQDLGHRQPRQRVEGADQARRPRQAPHPEHRRPPDHQPHPGEHAPAPRSRRT